VIRPAQPTATGWAGWRAAGGLDHADDPVAGHGVVDHVQIARLEDVQRQLAARQQDRPGRGNTGMTCGRSAAFT
jgi:hypothetical protein